MKQDEVPASSGQGTISDPRASLWAWPLTLVLCVVSAAMTLPKMIFVSTDYAAWSGDWQRAVGCLSRGEFPCPTVTKFPVAYLVNAGMVGTDQQRAAIILALANVACLTLPLVAVFLVHRPRAILQSGWPYVMALVLSPIPMFYLATGALEVQSGVFTGLYLGSLALALSAPHLKPGRAVITILVISGFAFPLYKDTAAALAGVVVLAFLAVHRSTLRSVGQTSEGRRRILALGLAAAAPVLFSQCLNAAYMWFKYGKPLPVAYMSESSETTPSWSHTAEFFVGSILSPNGGLVVFWSLPILVAVAGWRMAGLAPKRRDLLPAIGVLVLSAITFAHWWAPFGWIGWGDRLLLPASLALLIVMFMCLRPQEPRPVQPRRATTAVGLAVAVVAALSSAMYVSTSYLSTPGPAIVKSIDVGPRCVRLAALLPTAEGARLGSSVWKSDLYYDCARARMLYVPLP